MFVPGRRAVAFQERPQRAPSLVSGPAARLFKTCLYLSQLTQSFKPSKARRGNYRHGRPPQELQAARKFTRDAFGPLDELFGPVNALFLFFTCSSAPSTSVSLYAGTKHLRTGMDGARHVARIDLLLHVLSGLLRTDDTVVRLAPILIHAHVANFQSPSLSYRKARVKAFSKPVSVIDENSPTNFRAARIELLLKPKLSLRNRPQQSDGR